MLDLVLNMQAGAAGKRPPPFVCYEKIRQVRIVAAPICPVFQPSIGDLIVSVHAVLHHVPEICFGIIHAPNPSFESDGFAAAQLWR